MKKLFMLFSLIGFVSNAQDQLVSAVETREQKEPCLQTITGQIRDQVTNELILNTIVSLNDKEGNPVQTLMATDNAKFTFKVSCENSYTITARKEGYNSQSKTFTTSNDSGLELQTKILLDQGRIDFVTDPVGETKSNSLASMAASTNVEELIIDSAKAVEAPLKEKSANSAKEIAVEVTEEVKKVAEEPVIKKKQEIKEVTIKKTSSTVETTKNKFNEDILVLQPVIFDYESSYLNKQAKKDLLKVVNIMKKNPDLKLECASYTDAKGTEKYNLWMSERRAKRTVDYLVRRGIDPRRISGRGYGESKLINDCTEGEDCTDEQRAVNRRTEFKIVKK